MTQKQPRPRRAEVRAVSQVVLSIPTSDAASCFALVRDETLRWMARRAGRPLPRDAWDGKAFDLQDVGAQRTSATVLRHPVYWAARLDDADREVPQRTWRTEIGIGIRGPSEVLFGCRLFSIALGENPRYLASVPGLVRQIAARLSSRLDNRPVAETPWSVSSEAEVQELIEFLHSPNRKHPVIVASEGSIPGKYSIDTALLAKKVVGVAHVVTLSSAASYEVTDRLGKEFSVFSGAVRTYRPNFAPDFDEPNSHPIALGRSISQWDGDRDGAFIDFLSQQAMRHSVSSRELESEVPSFASILQLSAHEHRTAAVKEGQSDAELLSLADDEIRKLKDKAQQEQLTYTGLLAEAEKERDAAVAMAEGARGEAANLRSRIIYLEHALSTAGSEPSVEIPDSFDVLAEWSNAHLAGSLVVLNRALRAAKKSNFENPALGYRALLVLRDYYVPMRRVGEVGRRSEYEKRLQELGLEESPSFSGGRAAEQGDEYFVDYQGRRRELDRHLKGSNARDPRFGFRLYFFWDEDSMQVIVGSLPSHLSTRAS
jgi:hypothetical protein